MNEQTVMPFATTDALRFMLAGNAILTAESEVTGTHFTFRVRRAEAREPGQPEPRLWFVSVLTGSDNENDYQYLGLIRPPHGDLDGPLCYEHGLKSRIGSCAPSAKAIYWVVTHLLRNRPTPRCNIHHEGHCGRCGRTLTVPESILSGFGPECIQHV